MFTIINPNLQNKLEKYDYISLQQVGAKVFLQYLNIS